MKLVETISLTNLDKQIVLIDNWILQRSNSEPYGLNNFKFFYHPTRQKDTFPMQKGKVKSM